MQAYLESKEDYEENEMIEAEKNIKRDEEIVECAWLIQLTERS